MNEEEIAKKLGMKTPYFYRIENRDYEKLQTMINKGKVAANSFVYDVEEKQLIYVNADKTWNYIGDVDRQFISLTGTHDSPIRIGNLYDGLYIIQGDYSIKHMDVDYVAKAPIMVAVEVEESVPPIVHATVYTCNGSVIYKIGEDATVVDKMVTEETIIGVVNEVVEEQVTEITEEIVPSIVEESMEPASDQAIDDMIDSLFPDGPQPNGGD